MTDAVEAEKVSQLVGENMAHAEASDAVNNVKDSESRAKAVFDKCVLERFDFMGQPAVVIRATDWQQLQQQFPALELQYQEFVRNCTAKMAHQDAMMEKLCTELASSRSELASLKSRASDAIDNDKAKHKPMKKALYD